MLQHEKHVKTLDSLWLEENSKQKNGPSGDISTIKIISETSKKKQIQYVNV